MIEKSPCPCCGYKTFDPEPNAPYEICPVCFWEFDPVQIADPDYEGGANTVSLRQAKKNYINFGACEESMKKNVRRPTSEEERDIS